MILFLHDTQNKDISSVDLLRPHLIQVPLGFIINVDELNNILIKTKGNLKYYFSLVHRI